ncbi:hypothetical protein [Shimia thalassica]|nr:hypothetical protein [Shimia thalassica]MBU2943663.1 hypothetical protein [Shimia thalassica]MDO6501734.1 hypothetical protein [Shimia thalassica]MDO6797935.1 hypothetical protein [Shimia thalassica]
MRFLLGMMMLTLLVACQTTTNSDWEDPNRPGYSKSGVCMGGANCGWGR